MKESGMLIGNFDPIPKGDHSERGSTFGRQTLPGRLKLF